MDLPNVWVVCRTSLYSPREGVAYGVQGLFWSRDAAVDCATSIPGATELVKKPADEYHALRWESAEGDLVTVSAMGVF